MTGGCADALGSGQFGMRERIIAIALGVALLAAGLTGVFTSANEWLNVQRFSLFPRAASGDVVVVQIDAKSLNAVGVWPWPRSIHARLIDLLTRAGVGEIAFDVDFSHPSVAAHDAALAAALERAGGGVILPAFRQKESAGSDTSPLMLSVPIPDLYRHSWPGLVNVIPDADGIVREVELFAKIDGEIMPSMVQLLAGTNSGPRRALVDFAIDPETIPRVSYSDLLEGKVDPASLRNKKLIVGGTAIELGDHLTIPVHGVISGPVLQALAVETVLQGRMLQATSRSFMLGLFVLLVAVVAWLSLNRSWARDLVVIPALMVLIELSALAAYKLAPVLAGTAPLHALLAAYLIFSGLREIDFRSLLARIAIAEKRSKELLLERVLADSFDGIVIVDSSGRVADFNPAARQMVGNGRMLRWNDELLENVMLAGFASIALPAISEAMSEGKPVRRNLQLPSPGGVKHLELIVTKSMLAGGDAETYATLTFRDVSDYKEAELKARKAAEEANKANRAKSMFLASVSHELRTPLNAIIGFSEIMRNQILGSIGNSKYSDYVGIINDSGTHLLDLVNDIIDISRVEGGELVLNEEEFAFNDLFASVSSLVEGWPDAAKRKLSFYPAVDRPVVHADKRVLKQIIINLVSNAIKFTDDNGHISVRARLERSGGLLIEVADDGVGIESEDLPHVTKPFYQADAHIARQSEGSGLGLAVVAGYVKAHGGEITIDSEAGEGTTVRILLPAPRIVEKQTAA